MKYSCKKCNLETDKEYIWTRHIGSAKHKNTVGETSPKKVTKKAEPKKAPKRGKNAKVNDEPENKPLKGPINCPYCQKEFTMSQPLREHITVTCPKKPNLDSPFSPEPPKEEYKSARDLFFKHKPDDSPLENNNPFGIDFGGYDSYDSQDESQNPIFNPQKFAEIEQKLDELIRQIKMNNPREVVRYKPVYTSEEEEDPGNTYYRRNKKLIKL